MNTIRKRSRRRVQKLVPVFGDFNMPSRKQYGTLWRKLLARHRRNQSFARSFGDMRGENAQTRKELTEFRQAMNRIALAP